MTYQQSNITIAAGKTLFLFVNKSFCSILPLCYLILDFTESFFFADGFIFRDR